MTPEQIADLRRAAEHVIDGIELSDPADIGDILFQRSDKPLYLSNCYRVAEALPNLLDTAARVDTALAYINKHNNSASHPCGHLAALKEILSK